MPAAAPETASGSEAQIDHALAAIEAELGLVFANTDRVAASCGELRSRLSALTGPAHLADLQRLLSLTSRATPAVVPLADLLREAAAASPDPWPILQVLLGSRNPGIAGDTLDEMLRLAATGSLRVDEAVARTIADLVDREGSPLAAPESLVKLAGVLRHGEPATVGNEDPLVVLLVTPENAALRRLAARLLDLPGIPPSPEVTVRVLGTEAARALAPYLAYTRASHLDLVDLAAPDGTQPTLLPSLRRAEERCGPALLGEMIGGLGGWRRVNLGLDVRRVVGVSVDGSPPLLLTPGEAGIVEHCPGAVRAFDCLLAVAHGGTPPAKEPGERCEEAIARFRAYNLAHADVLADLLDIAPLTVEKVHTILDRMKRIVVAFSRLFASQADECATLAAVYSGLERQILDEMGAAPGEPLSAEVTRLVQMFEDPRTPSSVRTLHGLKRYLHQRGLALGFGLLEASRGTNRTVDLVLASPRRVLHTAQRVEYVDFEPESVPGTPAEAIPYSVAVVAEGFARQLLHGERSLPRVRVYCYGNEVHYFVYFRNHPAFIRVDYSPPLSGGMIDLEYYGVSKYELADHPGIALEGIQAFFRRLDFEVHADNTRIHARYDKERALDLADICEQAEALFRLVPYLMDVDWVIGDLDLAADARRVVGAAWADFFARWGVLPVRQLLTADRRGILAGVEPRPEGEREVRWSGEAPYADRFSGRPRETLLAELHQAHAARGLDVAPLVGRAEDAAQIPVERRLLQPLRAAVARGEVLDTADGLRPAPADTFVRQHEAERFAIVLAADSETIARSAQVAGLVAALERSLRFRTTGSVDGYDVQRAELRLRGETIGLFVLRDGAGILRLALFASGSSLCRSRESPGAPWQDHASSDAGLLAAHLRRNNFLPSWIDVPQKHKLEARAVRALFAVPNPGARARLLPGERLVSGLRASPGRAVGPARLGSRGREARDLEGGVLVAPTIGPADNAFLFHAAGVVCTGGGILSHAGLLAVQFGRPALIVTGAWRSNGQAAPSLVYTREEYDEVIRTVAGRRVIERRSVREHEDRIREGDLVVLDADQGELRVLGQDPAALVLHEGLRHLHEASGRLARAAADDQVLLERGRRLRALHQLERLFARLEDPVLVDHAVRELLLSATPAEAAGSLRERRRLLKTLQAHPRSAEITRDAVGRVCAQLASRHRAACGEARRQIPSSRDPAEVLTLRLAVVRSHEALQQARESVASGGGEPPAGNRRERDAVEALSVRQLIRIRDRLTTELFRSPSSDLAGARHRLRQLQRLGTVLPLSAEARQGVELLEPRLKSRDASCVQALRDRYVLWPDNGGIELEPLVGWKAANLAELERVGERDLVSPWFVVTDAAFRLMLALPAPGRTSASPDAPPATLGEAIDAIVTRTDADHAQKAALIRQLWDDVRLPSALVDEVCRAYRQLGTVGGESALPAPPEAGDDPGAPFVAVRSSSREEDTEVAARAGEFDTFLFVRGEEALLRHLRRGWSGLWTERALHNRAVFGRDAAGEGGGVLVQRIVWSRVSGVLQTTNVAEGRPREMVINVGLGIGEGIVSGLVAADHVLVSKEADLATAPLHFRYATADKRARVVFDARMGCGTVRVDTLSHQRLRPALEYVELLELVRAAARLEAAYGYPLDLEFGFEGRSLRILQVRPVPGSHSAWRETADRYLLAGVPRAPSIGEMPTRPSRAGARLGRESSERTS